MVRAPSITARNLLAQFVGRHRSVEHAGNENVANGPSEADYVQLAGIRDHNAQGVRELGEAELDHTVQGRPERLRAQLHRGAKPSTSGLCIRCRAASDRPARRDRWTPSQTRGREYR
jgi:hypothetical protein